DDGRDGDAVRARLRGEELVAPELLDLELVSVFRRQLAAGALDARRAQLALDDLHDLPIHRARHLPLLDRSWELRHNLTVYDAAYVALAEALSSVLVTVDARLGKVPGIRCAVEVVP